jgi:putative transport protein
MVRLLAESPLLLLFIVAALGLLAGRVKIGGFSLGVAAVLFVGLGAGALDPSLRLPELVYQFGLVVFVYTVGLSSGPGFFASFRRRGLRDGAFTLGLLVAGAGLAALAARVLHLRPSFAAGLFAGASTNTPALAAVIERLKAIAPPGAEALLAEPVVAYSVAYPGGVLGALAAIYLMQRLFRVDYAREPVGDAAVPRRLQTITVRVTRAEATREPVGELRRRHGLHVLFGRMKRGAAVTVVADDVVLALGDRLTVVGSDADLPSAVAFLGEIAAEHLELDRSLLDFRRMFVSRPEVTERPLSSLGLPQRFGATVTRIRRGDVDLLPDGNTQLDLGDRVRVVAPRERMDEIATFFGDSYKALSEIDVITFGLGIALGLLLGQLPIGLPGGPAFKLGSAGGPLIIGLVLGRLGRTGPMVWTLPYSANLTLRQLGLVLFLAGVGTRSGTAFASTLAQGGALALIGAGLVVTLAIALAALWVGHRVLKIPMGVLVGMVAGVQTQPAVLAFGLEQTQNELPNTGYAMVYPIATIAKIVLAQVLVGMG